MKIQRADTIAAVITPLGEGGIGVIQVLGARAVPIAEDIFRPTRPRDLSVVAEGRLCHGFVHDNDGPIDEVILRVCPRRQLVEINCHGGVAAVKQIFGRVCRAGVQAAGPEELLAETTGRDLDEIHREALRLLPQAPTRLAVHMLLGQYNGALSGRIAEMMREPDARVTREGLDAVLATADFGMALCTPRRIVVAGKPNVGKSTLVNALLREERVIVHHLPGTTRDAISETAELRGVPFEIIDTAGIRRAADGIEAVGVAESKTEIGRADVILLVLDLSAPLDAEDEELFWMTQGCEAVLIANKADRPPVWDVQEIAGGQVVSLSALTGKGLDALEGAIVRRYRGEECDPAGPIVFTQRQREALAAARAALDVQHIEEARRELRVCLTGRA
ncbi:MAG: GTP-binding protein [Planctomycetes bacterium]|nr:GTP-binding protein [Planctomycetota bacterium]